MCLQKICGSSEAAQTECTRRIADFYVLPRPRPGPIYPLMVSVPPQPREPQEKPIRRFVTHRTVSVLRFICACVCCGPLVAGCAALSRRPSPPPGYSSVHPPGFPSTIRWPGEMTEHEFQKWETVHLSSLEHAAHGRPVNVLVLSGGGGAGAFGAGVLVGWKHLGSVPSFQIVTGVSVGALIAPFAFLGPQWDRKLAHAFEGENAQPLLERRTFGWLTALFGWSAFRGAPLRALVDRNVTPAVLRGIAVQAARGRLLLVATTDLDRGGIIVWNMGAIAMHGGKDALRLFRQVLIASASIPGIFPPVLIPVEASGEPFDEMHVDGSASSSFLFAPGIVSILPHEIKPLQGANVYLIVNGHLRLRRETTANRTTAILMRSVDTELTSDSRARVRLVYSFAARQGMKLMVTEIPSSYKLGGFTSALKPARMRALFDYGERCATTHHVWGNALAVLNRVAHAGTPEPAVTQPCPAPLSSSP